MSSSKRLITILIICLWQCMCFAAKPNWLLLTERDLQAIYHFIKTQTPGANLNNDASYRDWLANGYYRYQQRRTLPSNYRGYEFSLRDYVNGFHDKQIRLTFFKNKKYARHRAMWPGFLVRYSQGQFIVTAYPRSSREKKIPPVGAHLVECDGLKAVIIMQYYVFPYFGNPALLADWIRYSPNILLDYGNPWVQTLRRCKFNYAGHEEQYDLYWQPLSDNIDLERIAFPYTGKFKSHVFSVDEHNDSLWVNIPSFQPKVRNDIITLQNYVKHAPDWRDKKVIVFDMRGNHSGETNWGWKLLKSLYGKEYYSWIKNRYPDKSYVMWRATKGNIKYIDNKLRPYHDSAWGRSTRLYKMLFNLKEDMEEALLDKEQFVTIKKETPERRRRPRPDQLLKAKIFILTDPRCNFACLSFIARAQNFPGVTLIGTSTDADSIYSEIREEVLPSGHVRLSFPVKATIDRKRKNNQPYVPKYEFPGDINNTHAIERWVIQLNHILSSQKQ